MSPVGLDNRVRTCAHKVRTLRANSVRTSVQRRDTTVARGMLQVPGMRPYQQQIDVVAGIRRAFAQFKYHRAFTRRVKPIIESELPGYTVSVDPDHFGLRTIRVWGNGLPYENGSVYLCWNSSKPWAEGMAEAIEIADPSDYQERVEAEQPLRAKLDELNARVEAARAEAAALVAALPVPASATIRADHPTWSGPTSELRKAYPLLFETVRS